MSGTEEGSKPGRFSKPGIGILWGRALRLKCIRCGGEKMFRNGFQMHERCGTCGLKYERDPGYFLGSTYINYMLTAVILTVTYVTLRFGQEIPNRTLTPWLVAFCVLFPLLFFRFARAFWMSMDAALDGEGFWDQQPDDRTR